MSSHRAAGISVVTENHSSLRAAQPDSRTQKRVEHDVQIESRTAPRARIELLLQIGNEGAAWARGLRRVVALGFVVLPCCVFAGLRLIVRRRFTETFLWADDHTLPHQGGRCAPQQNSASIGSFGS
jgi:hypothetical protein